MTFQFSCAFSSVTFEIPCQKKNFFEVIHSLHLGKEFHFYNLAMLF